MKKGHRVHGVKEKKEKKKKKKEINGAEAVVLYDVVLWCNPAIVCVLSMAHFITLDISFAISSTCFADHMIYD